MVPLVSLVPCVPFPVVPCGSPWFPGFPTVIQGTLIPLYPATCVIKLRFHCLVLGLPRDISVPHGLANIANSLYSCVPNVNVPSQLI